MLSTNTRARKAPESSMFWIAIYTAMADIRALIINKANKMLLNSLPFLLVSSGVMLFIYFDIMQNTFYFIILNVKIITINVNIK